MPTTPPVNSPNPLVTPNKPKPNNPDKPLHQRSLYPFGVVKRMIGQYANLLDKAYEDKTELTKINPDALAHNLLAPINQHPVLSRIKAVFLAENPATVWTESDKANPSKWQNPLTWVGQKLFADGFSTGLGAATRLGRRLLALSFNVYESTIQQVKNIATQALKELPPTEVKTQPHLNSLRTTYSTLQLASSKTLQTVQAVRNTLAKQHPQFTDEGLNEAADQVQRVLTLPDKALHLDEFLLKKILINPGNQTRALAFDQSLRYPLSEKPSYLYQMAIKQLLRLSTPREWWVNPKKSEAVTAEQKAVIKSVSADSAPQPLLPVGAEKA
jgi:hypothetical protein